ncbi:WbuC family cupin fold metalloprotein [Prochlorococcus sp. MIT 1300]|uniref:WbuC family cupin fold metalloprotein n=1 Tax=Prochlorococcus sp. MIT 1300 TaxID=3096218 RepID=UPI0039BF9943
MVSSNQVNLIYVNENTLRVNSSGFIFKNEYRLKLIELAKKHKSGSARICLHGSTLETTQNMIICLMPHKSFQGHFHPKGKKESYTILSGVLYVERYSASNELISTEALTASNTPYMHLGGEKHLPYTKEEICLYQEVYHGTFIKNKDVIPF